MASPTLFHFFFFIPLLLMIINSSHSSDLKNADAKVNVSLYYETLCPGSEYFVVNQLGVLFKSELMSIVNLHLVPYGNAFIENGTVKCQHGLLECFYNTIEACALDVWPLEKSFPFIHCVEAGLQLHVSQDLWESCCMKLRLDPKVIKNCYESGQGTKLILRNANETEGLIPPRTYVPWVIVDGKKIDDFENVVKYICNAYKGQRKFKACEMQVVTTSAEKMKSTQAVCHANVDIIRTIKM